MKKYMLILNYVAFQICWLALLSFENTGVLIFFIFINIHLALVYYIDSFNHLVLELVTILLVSIIGISIDLVLTSYDVYIFHNTLGAYMPLWYLVIWPLYATTLNHCFYLFHQYGVLLLGLLGAVSVPVIYSGAQGFAVNFRLGEPTELSLIAIASVWFFVLPLTIKLTVILRHYFIGLNNGDIKTEKY